jgi:hypothetical protein
MDSSSSDKCPKSSYRRDPLPPSKPPRQRRSRAAASPTAAAIALATAPTRAPPALRDWGIHRRSRVPVPALRAHSRALARPTEAEESKSTHAARRSLVQTTPVKVHRRMRAGLLKAGADTRAAKPPAAGILCRLRGVARSSRQEARAAEAALVRTDRQACRRREHAPLLGASSPRHCRCGPTASPLAGRAVKATAERPLSAHQIFFTRSTLRAPLGTPRTERCTPAIRVT